jgi:hypothetical protein
MDHQSMSQLEAALRDYLADHLDLIESGLSLVRTEYPLSNSRGSGGFIDILARDSTGDIAVIELKRSDQTARQALHELEKYIALLAEDRGIRVDRVRCILVSTTWRELLIPFARFVRHADFHATGRLLLVGPDGFPTGSEPVALPAPSTGLETCPIHLNLLFTTPNARDKAAGAVAEKLDDLCVTDYIVADLDYTGSSDHIIFPFSHYMVLAEFSEEMREFIRNEFPDDCEDEPTDSPWWHEQVVQAAMVRALEVDKSVETSSPGTFRALSGWQTKTIVGHGRYADEVIWPAHQLRRVIEAEGDRYSAPFDRQVTVANRPAWRRMREDLDRCLLGSGDWPEIVSRLQGEIEHNAGAELIVHAYAPTDILWGLDHLMRTRGDSSYMPQLLIAWRDGNTETLIAGRLHWDGKTRVTSLDQTVGVIFRDFEDYLFTHALGGLWELETELCELHGLRYDVVESTWEVNADGLGETHRVSLTSGGGLRREKVGSDEPQPADFVASHHEYLAKLVAAFDRTTRR